MLVGEQPDDAPTWRCPAGTVVGWRDRGALRATGIRYAAADRYAPPRAEPPSSEVVRATSWAPACPQAPMPLLDAVLPVPRDGLTADEHCQRLSITVPEGTDAGAGLPVMVWIHGGSYTAGAGDLPVFDPAPLVREQRVVVVAVTYRLGLFGFLGSHEGTPANLGLLDLIEALRWVQRNVSGFGGDPANVTLFGQSAGGDAVAHLMIADGARGLFRRAIVQSAPLGISRGRARMSAAMAHEAARIPRDAAADDVVAAQQAVVARAGGGLTAAMPFGTQYGFPPLPPEEAVDSAWRRAASEVEVLIGCTSREAALFVPAVPVLERFRDVPVTSWLVEALVRVVSWKVYGSAVASFARRHRRGGGRGYRYRIRWGAPGNRYAGAHTVDLPLLFGDRDVWAGAGLVDGATWDELEAAGREVRRLWAGFARDGQVGRPSVRGVISVRRI